MATRIKPKPGCRVRDQHSELLPAEGIVVESVAPYWLRREADGEVEIAAVVDKKTKD